MIRVLLADDQVLVRAGFRMLLESAGDITVIGEAANGGVAVALTREHAPDIVLMDLHMPEVDGITATRLIAGDPGLAATRVIALTTFDDDQTVYAALRAGASGFLVKDVEPEELLHAVRVVARGDALLSPSVTRAVISAFTAVTPGATQARNPKSVRPAAQRGSPTRAGTPDAAGHSAGAGTPAGAGHSGQAGRPAGAGHSAGAGRPAGTRASLPGLASLTEREREVVALVAAGLSNDEIGRELVVSPLTAKTHVSRAMTKLSARDRAQLVVFAYEHGLTGT